MEGLIDPSGFSDLAEAGIIRADGSYESPGISVNLAGLAGYRAGGPMRIECRDRDGHLRWVDDTHNALTLAALDDINNVYFRNGTPKAAFYIGLVDNSGFTTFAQADTMVSHTGWSENTQYTPSGRVAWAPAASSSQAVVNTSVRSFVMTAAASIRGILVCSDASASTSGVLLLSTAPFSTGAQAVNSGDTITVTYTIAASSS